MVRQVILAATHSPSLFGRLDKPEVKRILIALAAMISVVSCEGNEKEMINGDFSKGHQLFLVRSLPGDLTRRCSKNEVFSAALPDQRDTISLNSGGIWCQKLRGKLTHGWEVVPAIHATHELIIANGNATLIKNYNEIMRGGRISDSTESDRSIEAASELHLSENFSQFGFQYSDDSIIVLAKSEHGKPPHLILKKHGSKSVVRNRILYLDGGPFQGVNFDLLRNYTARYILEFISQEVEIVVPLHIGTTRVYIDGKADIAGAVDEIVSIANENSDQNVCLIGQSLGGYLAPIVAENLDDLSYLSINPLLQSPQQFYSKNSSKMLTCSPEM